MGISTLLWTRKRCFRYMNCTSYVSLKLPSTTRYNPGCNLYQFQEYTWLKNIEHNSFRFSVTYVSRHLHLRKKPRLFCKSICHCWVWRMIDILHYSGRKFSGGPRRGLKTLLWITEYTTESFVIHHGILELNHCIYPLFKLQFCTVHHRLTNWHQARPS